MPVEQTTTLNITCNNPACPGNNLDPTDRAGWLFVTTEVYGDPTQSHVYCCADCAGADAASSFDTPDELKPSPPPERPSDKTDEAAS